MKPLISFAATLGVIALFVAYGWLIAVFPWCLVILAGIVGIGAMWIAVHNAIFGGDYD